MSEVTEFTIDEINKIDFFMYEMINLYHNERHNDFNKRVDEFMINFYKDYNVRIPTGFVLFSFMFLEYIRAGLSKDLNNKLVWNKPIF